MNDQPTEEDLSSFSPFPRLDREEELNDKTDKVTN